MTYYGVTMRTPRANPKCEPIIEINIGGGLHNLSAKQAGTFGEQILHCVAELERYEERQARNKAIEADRAALIVLEKIDALLDREGVERVKWLLDAARYA